MPRQVQGRSWTGHERRAERASHIGEIQDDQNKENPNTTSRFTARSSPKVKVNVRVDLIIDKRVKKVYFLYSYGF